MKDFRKSAEKLLLGEDVAPRRRCASSGKMLLLGEEVVLETRCDKKFPFLALEKNSCH